MKLDDISAGGDPKIGERSRECLLSTINLVCCAWTAKPACVLLECFQEYRLPGFMFSKILQVVRFICVYLSLNADFDRTAVAVAN